MYRQKVHSNDFTHRKYERRECTYREGFTLHGKNYGSIFSFIAQYFFVCVVFIYCCEDSLAARCSFVNSNLCWNENLKTTNVGDEDGNIVNPVLSTLQVKCEQSAGV